MPIYKYSCEECGLSFEKIVASASKEFDKFKCPKCGSSAEKIPSPFSVRVSNSGSYMFDKEVGAAANDRWESYHKKQEQRKELGIKTESVSHNIVVKTEDGVSSFPVSDRNYEEAKDLFPAAPVRSVDD